MTVRSSARLQRCGVLVLAVLTCSCAFQVPPIHQYGSCWPLHAADTNVAIAKNTFLRIAAAILSVPPEVFTTPPMLEPPIRSPGERAHREATSRVLAKGWNKSDGFEIPLIDELLVNKGSSSLTDHHLPSTYGEITELGARQLFEYMHMKDAEEDMTLFDLGSGAGKFVVQAYAELPRLRRVVGIELAPARHATAVRAWNSIRDTIEDVRAMRGPCQGADLELWEADLFETNFSVATHVYVASLCFTSDMMERLADKLANEALALRKVATLQVLPKRLQWRFGEPQMEFVEMSWTKPLGKGCAVYFYTPPRSIPQ